MLASADICNPFILRRGPPPGTPKHRNCYPAPASQVGVPCAKVGPLKIAAKASIPNSFFIATASSELVRKERFACGLSLWLARPRLAYCEKHKNGEQMSVCRRMHRTF